FAQIAYHQMRTMLLQLLGTPLVRDAALWRCGGRELRGGGVVYTDTCRVAPGARVRVAAPIRISIPSPPTSVPCTSPSVMRIATDRPLQHTRNDRLRHCGGSLGSTPSMSPFRSRPAKPSITAWHSAPSPAIRTPPALLGSKSRSLDAVARKWCNGIVASPSRAATNACIPVLSELPCAQRGS